MDLTDKTLLITPRQNFRVVAKGRGIQKKAGADCVQHLNIESITQSLVDPNWETYVERMNQIGIELTFNNPIPFLNMCVDLNLPSNFEELILDNIPVSYTKPFKTFFAGYYVTPILNPLVVQFEEKSYVIKCASFGTINTEQNVFEGQQN